MSQNQRELSDGIVPAILALVVGAGLVLRVSASRFQEPIVDEVLSLLGAQMVAQQGIPLLPSGVLYLHGAVHSYLVAPFLATGFGGLDNYFPLRLVSAAAGAIAIVLTFRLAQFVGATAAASLLAAALVAIDPASILWSGYLRMYALAQAMAVAVALLFVQAISSRSEFATPGKVRTRTLWGLVVVFWLAVFSHLATALLWPAMVLVAIIVFGEDLIGRRRDLTLSLAGCLLAPLTLILLTGAIGPGAGTALEERSEGLPGISFLGEDNVNLAQVLQPNPSPWTSLFAAGPLALLVPLLVALASGLLVGRWFLAPEEARAHNRRSVGGLLALHWLPIIALAMFATDAAERYAVFLLPTGYVLLALAADALMAPTSDRLQAGWAAAAGAVLAVALLLHGAVGLARQGGDESGRKSERASFLTARDYIAASHQPGELILTTSPVGTALSLGSPPELRFLPGGERSQRSLRYTRFTDAGEPIDYWMGMPSLATTPRLCSALAESPGSWIMVSNRIWDTWGYNDLSPRQMERSAETMRRLISGVSDLDYEDPNTRIFRSRPSHSWSEEAETICAESDKLNGRGNRRDQVESGE